MSEGEGVEWRKKEGKENGSEEHDLKPVVEGNSVGETGESRESRHPLRDKGVT